MAGIEAHVCRAIGGSDRVAIEAYQLRKLGDMLCYARQNSPHYKVSLANMPVLFSLAQISKLPFTTADDLRYRPYKLLCVSAAEVARTYAHFTTGTTGRPKKIFFSRSDTSRIIDYMSDMTAGVLKDAGFEPQGAKVGVYLPNFGRPLSMAEMIASGVWQFGGTPYIGSCEDIAEDQLKEIFDHRPLLLMGSCFRIWRMTQVGREYINLKEAGVRAIFITSEYMSPEQRRRMEACWNAEVFHHYGMTEPGFAIGIECKAHSGFHYDESAMLYEVVDPSTGTLLPDGQEGELVFTSLQREAMPLIRYRTGDSAAIFRERCACGSFVARIGVMTKRIGMIHTLDTGGDIFSSMLDDALYLVDDLLDYRLFLEPDGKLVCKTERIGDLPGFEKRVSEKLLSVCCLRRAYEAGEFTYPQIEICPRATLRRGGRTMKQKIVDERGTAND